MRLCALFCLLAELLIPLSVLGSDRQFDTHELRIEARVKEDYVEAGADAPVEGSPAEVWRVLTDYGNQAEYMPNVKKCKVEGRSGNTIRLYFEVGLSIFTVSYTAELREEKENQRQTWRLLEGPFRINSGSWSLESAGANRTRLKYHLRISHAIFPDAILMRIITSRLPAVYQAIQKRVDENRSRTAP